MFGAKLGNKIIIEINIVANKAEKIWNQIIPFIQLSIKSLKLLATPFLQIRICIIIA